MARKGARSSLNKKRLKHAKKLLREEGVSFVGTTLGVAQALRGAGLVPEGTRPGRALDNVYLRGRKLTAKGLLLPHVVADFYQTSAWRRLAYQCKKRDGRRCMCCGATPEDGVRIVSDHVVPIRLRWDLRLDPANIQTLCDECNLGKGSTDQTDFRIAAE